MLMSAAVQHRKATVSPPGLGRSGRDDREARRANGPAACPGPQAKAEAVPDDRHPSNGSRRVGNDP